ncbi:hypothetical protein [Aliikangiella sp. IMCC44359]|uniref:hypothetical protein n=1 Tax=Aliikangiella sp. IMCC44359 TaxID=3459125 RepID=UPI00403B1263
MVFVYKIKMIMLKLAILMLLSSAASFANAAKICFKYYSTFTDAGIGEDYFSSSRATARTARGGWVKISQNGVEKWTNYLDRSGCTPNLSNVSSGQINYKMWASAKVANNNRVWINDDNSDVRGTHSANYNISSGTTTIAFTPNSTHRAQFNVLAAAVYAVDRFPGGVSNQYFRIRTNTSKSAGSHFRTSGTNGDPTVYMCPCHTNKKFVIVHELGHMLTYFNKGSRWVNDCGFSSTSCPASRGGHSMASKEYSSCAASEGFAHFYAAVAFNDTSQDNCSFHYYKNEFGNDSSPIVNCEAGNGQFVTRYLENECVGSQNGYSTELDYLRAYWDVLTDGTGNPSFTSIINWGSRANWGTSNATQRLNSSATSTINNKWTNARDRNGLH